MKKVTPENEWVSEVLTDRKCLKHKQVYHRFFFTVLLNMHIFKNLPNPSYFMITTFSRKEDFVVWRLMVLIKKPICNQSLLTMVLLIDGNSEISTHFRSNLSYLICLRHLIRSRAVVNRIFLSGETYFP